MRILVLQFTPATRGRRLPRFEPQLATLLALLERRDHQLTLEGLARFDLERSKAALARALPQLIYADVSPVCVDAARRTFEHIERREFLPIVVGGLFATVDPAAALSLPGVRAVAIGEPDASLVTYLERLQDPTTAQVVSGVWLRDEQGTARPALPPLVEDLTSLPFAHRTLFGYAEWLRQTGEVEIAVGRGCPQQCAYCPNATVAALYLGGGQWVRRRPPAHICAEIKFLGEHYANLTRVRFLDHAFTLDADWLTEFLPLYRTRCGLPFRCHVRANQPPDTVVPALAAAGCQTADIEVISGSDFLRNEIFNMDLSAEQLSAAFGALRCANIRTRAIVYLGAPYESEAALDETRALLLRLRPAVVDVRPYYPWPGTSAREVAREHGWIHPRGEERYHRDQVGIQMPACRPPVVQAFVRRLRREFPTTWDEPWWRRWTNHSRAALERVLERRWL